MSFLQTISEGGQTWIHRIRMAKQVLKIALGFSTLIWVIFFAYQMGQVPATDYQGSWYNLKARIASSFFDEISVERDAWGRVAHEQYSLKNPSVGVEKVIYKTQRYWKSLTSQMYNYANRSGQASSIAFLSMLSFFWIRGRNTKKKHHISGKKLISGKNLAFKIKAQGKASKIEIGPVPYVKGTETQHTLITGGTGSGKTNCLHHILFHIRKQGQKAVVIDTVGTFVDRYYREGKDVLMNPFDKSGVPWNLWCECKNKFDYDSMAENFIPSSHSEHENYWRRAAQTVFSALIEKTSRSKNTSDLIRWILFEPLPELCRYLEGTKAASLIDINSEKTAASIRSVASSYLSCLEHLEDTEKPFSIKNWIKTADNDSWLFLNCNSTQRKSISPLLVSWISTAIEGLLEMGPDLDRRVWFVIDELQTLNHIHGLETLLTESRKYGGCALLSLQSPSQLEDIYGREKTRVIIGNCSTKVAFADQDPDVAKKISQAFGDCEIKEYQRGISYGANDIRDGVNLSIQQKNKPIVKASDILSLKNNTAFLKVAGNFPVSKVRFSLIT